MPLVSPVARVRDGEFLDEVPRNETRPPVGAPPPLPEGTLEALEEGLPIVDADAFEVHGFARLDRDTEDALAVFSDEQEKPVPQRLSRDQIVWLVSGFLTLILMGMVGAALIFLDRTVDIVAVLR